MAISHCYWHLVVKNGNFTLLLTSSGQIWQMNLLGPKDPLGTRADVPCIPVQTTWQMNLLWPMDPNPPVPRQRCLEYLYTILGRWTYFAQWTPKVTEQKCLLIATDIKWSRMAISHCYWHLVVKNGNFTLLLISSGQEWQFHTATDI